jgi:hypothetical protein
MVFQLLVYGSLRETHDTSGENLLKRVESTDKVFYWEFPISTRHWFQNTVVFCTKSFVTWGPRENKECWPKHDKEREGTADQVLRTEGVNESCNNSYRLSTTEDWVFNNSGSSPVIPLLSIQVFLTQSQPTPVLRWWHRRSVFSWLYISLSAVDLFHSITRMNEETYHKKTDDLSVAVEKKRTYDPS